MNVKIRHTPLGEKVFRRLTAEIENETFKQGAFLPAERELALRFGVSRVVVRETTKRLEQSGFVTSRRGVGVQVTNNPSLPVQQIIRRMLPGDAERLRQSAEARRLIEPELAALAALKATPGAIAALGVPTYGVFRQVLSRAWTPPLSPACSPDGWPPGKEPCPALSPSMAK